MFGWSRRRVRRAEADGLRIVNRRQFCSEVSSTTARRADHTHLYLMLEQAGVIGVKWEYPGGGQVERFRIVDRDQGGCPHCAILDSVEVLADVLPLDPLRVARTRSSYEMTLRMGRLPCPAFAVRSDGAHPRGEVVNTLPTAGWVADCHAADGDPHTGWDCPDHTRI